MILIKRLQQATKTIHKHMFVDREEVQCVNPESFVKPFSQIKLYYILVYNCHCTRYATIHICLVGRSSFYILYLNDIDHIENIFNHMVRNTKFTTLTPFRRVKVMISMNGIMKNLMVRKGIYKKYGKAFGHLVG